ncbi:hypothetical protein KG918_003444 [Salmonella enterica]|uniref:ImcF-related family protein n=1 Tax=Salmonella enterica TaxID=28901 RepID=UPI001CF1031F|nr:hypothetical protein [Salmonella enterica]MCB2248337.1 hypothetical protein [Salmonella enterica subsp. diarizonae]EFP3608145.1 hypothetical protein [Salmonella enterica]EGY4498179.1 hypothetical protein [Salmonella enterica]EGY4504397.1 hypothetical protein [Salmonella enterica]
MAGADSGGPCVMGILLVLVAASLLYLQQTLWLPHAFARGLPAPSVTGWLVVTVCVLLVYLAVWFGLWHRAPHRLDEEGIPAPPLSEDELQALPQYHLDLAELKQVLHHRYGWRWKRRLPWLLVTGAVRDVDAAAPGLVQQGWQFTGDVLLLWGGDIASGGNQPDLAALRRLRGRRPVDAIILAGHHDSTLTPVVAGNQLYGLWTMQRALNWLPPLYRLDIHALPWPGTAYRKTFSAALSTTPFTAQTLESALTDLTNDLVPYGMAEVVDDNHHHFWLYLSSVLREGGAERLLAFFKPFFTGWHPFALYGVVLAVPEAPEASEASLASREYRWRPSVIWDGIAAHCRRLRGRPAGVDGWRVVRWSAAGVLLLCGAGVVTSAVSNMLWLRRVSELVAQIHAAPQASRLAPLQQVMTEQADWLQHGAPWYRRAGLDITRRVQPVLPPAWEQLSRQVILNPAQTALERLLAADSDNDQTTVRYNHLKTYLMLATPSWVDNRAAQTFLTQQLATLLPAISPDSLAFFVRQFAAQRTLHLTPDDALVARTRRSLLDALAGPQAETQLYQQMLRDVNHNYAEMTLDQMTDGESAAGLFTLDAAVPGAFTREAYDGAVRPQIAALVQTRREQISRVLADPVHPAEGALSPEGLGVRLTQRYLTDYAAAWRSALNRIQPVVSGDPLQQLTRLADRNRSPLVLLMQSLTAQGLVASPDERHAVVNPLLAPVFGGIVGMASHDGKVVKDGISLSAWLTDITRLRDRVRSLSALSGSTEVLATSVFSGTQIDNAAADLPERITCQLGPTLQPMAKALFIAPTGQTWKGVMRGGMSQMDTQWQQEIVSNWRQHFDHCYPFSASATDCNLADVADFIRPDTGLIAEFIAQHLRGVLVYRNNRWQVAGKLPPGLAVSPQFLAALNRLSRVGNTLFADGFGLHFRLQPGTARDVVQTELTIDGQDVTYFNQMPFWQDIRWPGTFDSPGTMLLWTSVRAGARIYRDMPGQWGFIRLLDRAKATEVDNHHLRLSWTAPDGLSLNYLLETDPAHNPLTVLTLKNFQLPDAIFSSRR